LGGRSLSASLAIAALGHRNFVILALAFGEECNVGMSESGDPRIEMAFLPCPNADASDCPAPRAAYSAAAKADAAKSDTEALIAIT